MRVYKSAYIQFIRYGGSKCTACYNPRRYQYLGQFRSASNSICNVFRYNALLDSIHISSIPKYGLSSMSNKHTNADFNTSADNGIDNVIKDQQISLLQSYRFRPNKPLDFRVNLCNKILIEIENSTSPNAEQYNEYLKICIKNEINIDNTFLNSMKCQPNEETYKLLLESVCEKGDTDQAYDILSKIKENNYVADERVFNALILAHTVHKGREGAQVVLNTMKAAQVVPSSNTNWYILIGLAIRNDEKEFIDTIETLSFTFNEEYFLKALKQLALNNNERLIKILKRKFNINFDILPRQLLSLIEELCMYLIFKNKVDISIRIYCNFTGQNAHDEYCNTLLKEILKVGLEPEEILNICQYLKDVGKHEHALEFITNMALISGRTEYAWSFLKQFDELRPHYFWPLLLQSGRENGELGVINALNKMLELNVEINSETLETYVLPFCDISSPKAFLSRVLHLKINLRQLLTPLLTMLLRNNQINAARELCDEFKVPVDASRLIRPFATAWKKDPNTNHLVKILKRIYEDNETSNIDFIGNVLLVILKSCKEKEDYDKFLNFLQTVHMEKLTISSLSGENIDQILQARNNCHNRQQIVDLLDNLLDISMSKDDTHISHPRNMTVDELECHLIELTNKNMETRGVLRRLIQSHGKLGNYQRLQELKGLLEKSEYRESPGMKATRLQTYIKTKQLQPALELFEELRRTHPNFKIDEYKLIDLAALLLTENKYEIALQLLQKECSNRSVRGDLRIEHNCVDLLLAAKNPIEATTILHLLIDNKLCQPTNVILGAVLRSYMKCRNLPDAVEYYKSCCKKYKRTPLQVELLKELVEANHENLLTSALNATATVYGTMKAKMSLAVAFAEKRKTETLTKLLLDIKYVSNSELQNRCNRLVNDRKLEALLTFAKAASRLPQNVINLSIIHIAIIQLYDINNDIEGALKFVDDLKENDVIISHTVTNLINNLVNRNKPRKSNRFTNS